MRLTESAFTALVDEGCPACGGKKLTVEALVAQKVPLLAGEVYGSPSWAYKGEELVHGTFRVACHGCTRELYASSGCPRCDAEGKLEHVLESPNAFALPVRCDGCGSEQIAVTAYVPVTVVYEGKRGAKARTQTTPEDEGFHAFRAECKSCRRSTEQRTPCPACS